MEQHEDSLSAEAVMYFHLYRCMERPEEESLYRTVRRELTSCLHELDSGEAVDLFGILINYCTAKLNAGNDAFLIEMWELYREMLDEKKIRFLERYHDQDWQSWNWADQRTYRSLESMDLIPEELQSK